MERDRTVEPDAAPGSGHRWAYRAWHFPVVVLVSMVLAEFFVMTVVMPALPSHGRAAEALLDSVLTSILVSPVLYFFLMRPLERQLSAQAGAERELSGANELLAGANRELQQRGVEASVLSEMDDLLQTSRSLQEAYRVVERAAQKLFPELSGAVLVLANSRNLSEQAARWGEDPLPCAAERCNPDDCWALRRAQLHVVDGSGLSIPCAAAEGAGGHACAPMVAQGEALGVVCLTSDAPFLDAQRERLVTATRHVALSLANLRLHDTLHRQSVCDPLTGLFNRRYLQATLDRELHRARRRELPVSVLMIDVDHFKRFNDDFGHDVGDLVLQEVGRLLRRATRAEDIVCRYGGEEFVVIMPEATLEVGAARAEVLRAQVERLRIAHQGETLRPVSISAGVSAFPGHGEEIAGLLQAADAALYQSKAGGRNRVTVAPLPSASPAAASA